MASNMQEQALSWRKQAVSVIPVRPGSKIAAIAWSEYQKRLPTYIEVLKWFKNEKLNLGVLVGSVSSNLVVLDFDDADFYQQWLTAHTYLDTYTVQTSRGAHLYFYVDELPKRTLSIDHLDVKSSGYVLGAGSVHPSGFVHECVCHSPIMQLASTENYLPPADKPKINPSVGGGISSSNTRVSAQATPQHCIHQSARDPRTRRELIRLIKSRLSMVDFLSSYTDLTPSGGRFYMAVCPMHGDTQPSLSVDGDNQKCQCFSPTCPLHEPRGLGFDVVDAYKILHGCDTYAAISCLGRRVGLLQ